MGGEAAQFRAAEHKVVEAVAAVVEAEGVAVRTALVSSLQSF
jgi:hypothetical protein